MGIEWILVDNQKKQYFELGKGGWQWLVDKIEDFSNAEHCKTQIQENCNFANEDYINQLAQKLSQIYTDSSLDLSLYCDCDNYSDIPLWNYELLGSRYYPDTNWQLCPLQQSVSNLESL